MGWGAQGDPLPRSHPAQAAAGGGSAGAQERAGKGHFRLNVLRRLETALVKSLALLGGLRWSVSRPCPPPHDQSRRSKLAQMLGRFGSNPAVVWIALACLASCGTWAFGQDTAPRSPQGPVSQRSLSPKPTHMCSITARWPAGPHPAPPGAWSPRWQLALHFPGGAGGGGHGSPPRGPCVALAIAGG